MRSRVASVLIGCILAIVTAAVVAVLRSVLESWLHQDAPLLIFVATTIVAAWYGGFIPGVLATALGAGAGAYYFAQPTESLWIDETSERLWMIMFVVIGVMISLVCEALHRSRIRAERSAREALETQQQLREADRRKNDFVATLAHELRNPLAAINSAVAVVQMKHTGDSVLHECSEVIGRQAGQMTRMVDDLLDLSRISCGKVALRREPMDLSHAVRRAIEACLPRIEAHEHELEVDVPEMPVWVDGDVDRLTQVVTNLLNNAAKYTPDGGRVAVTLATEGDQAVVRVRDDGIGIPADLLPGIFHLYTQVEGSRGRSDGGLGIGLSLVHHLAEMHGGAVEALSEGPGKGSEFVVRLRRLPESSLAAPETRG